MADSAQFMHYNEFANMRRMAKTQLKAQIEQLFIEKAKHSLVSKPLLVNPKFADVAATDIIVKGQRIFENVEQCDVTSNTSKMKKIEKDKLYRMSDRFRNLKDEAILVFKTSPRVDDMEQCDGSGAGKTEGMEKVFPNLGNNPVELPVTYASAKDKKEINHELKQFFNNTASRVKTAVIVFDGLFQHEKLTLGNGSSLALSSFLSEIRDVLHECFGRYLLPFTVDIAYQEYSTNASVHELATYVNVVSMSYRNKLSLTSHQFKVYLPELHSSAPGQSASNEAQRSGEGNYFSSTQGSAQESCLHVSPSTWSVEELGYDEVD